MKKNSLTRIVSLIIFLVFISCSTALNSSIASATANQVSVSMNDSPNITDNPFVDVAHATRLFDLRTVRSPSLQSIVTSQDGSAVTYRFNSPGICIGATLQSIKLSFHVGGVALGNGGNSHKIYSGLYNANSAESFTPIPGTAGNLTGGGSNMIVIDIEEPNLVSYSAPLSLMPNFNGSNFNIGAFFFFEDEGSVDPDYVSDVSAELTYDASTCPKPEEPGKGGSSDQISVIKPSNQSPSNVKPPKTGELLIALIAIPIALLVASYAYLAHHRKSILKSNSER
jgi:hypothetical protein